MKRAKSVTRTVFFYLFTMILPYREFFRLMFYAMNPTSIQENRIVWYNNLGRKRVPLAFASEPFFTIFCECGDTNYYWDPKCRRCGTDNTKRRNLVRKCITNFTSTEAGQQHAYVYTNSRVFRESDMNEICSICLGQFDTGNRVHVAPKCGHQFHPNCMRKWIQRSFTCPLCRRDLRECTFQFVPDPV